MTVAQTIIERMRNNTARLTAPYKQSKEQRRRERKRHVIQTTGYHIGFGRFHRSH